MPKIEDYLEHVDQLAQDTVNAWGINTTAGNASLLSDEFKSLFDKARNAKNLGDNHRGCGMFSKQDEAEEKASRLDFVGAYKTFWEKHNAAA